MLKAYKYRIYPNEEQAVKLDKTISTCRLVYNLALETNIRAWESARKTLSAFDLCYQLPELKEAFPWIAEVDSQALQASIKKIDKKFTSFFKGNSGYPKFKSKRDRQSFRCPSGVRRINWDTSTLTIPKIKNIPIVLSRKFCGEIKTVTISKAPTGKYFASVLVDDELLVPVKKPIRVDAAIGIDIGIKSFAVTSDGRSFKPNQHLKNNLKRLQCLQKRASGKKKGGKNYSKSHLAVALLHEKITNQRLDYIHKITSELIRDNQVDTFVIEDLNVSGMMKNHKISRAIADASFGEFKRQMQYKCDWYGKTIILVDKFAPSSKRCSDCGTINRDLTLSDREWTCECGAYHDRDLNAAKNIKFFGLNTPADSRGEPVESSALAEAMKQEKRPRLMPQRPPLTKGHWKT